MQMCLVDQLLHLCLLICVLRILVLIVNLQISIQTVLPLRRLVSEYRAAVTECEDLRRRVMAAATLTTSQHISAAALAATTYQQLQHGQLVMVHSNGQNMGQ